MRCTECGYDGRENVAGGNCIKCGAKLQSVEQSPNFSVGGDAQTDSQLKQTVIQTGGYADSSQSLKKTVVQGAFEMSSDNMQATVCQRESNQWNGAATVVEGIQNVSDDIEDNDNDTHEHYSPIMVDGKLECPKCHYPLSSDSLTSCPNCMADFTGLDEDESEDELHEKEIREDNKDNLEGTVGIGAGIVSRNQNEDVSIECDNCKKLISASYKYCPYCANEVVKKTVVFKRKRKKNEELHSSIDAQTDAQTEPQILCCHLSLLPDDDEEVEAITNKYEGNNIVLNRANTEQGNQSITSKEQAELINENGNWYIENRSEYGTTFLTVNRRLPLMPGDIIMLGDRRFVFGIDDSK